MRVRFRDKFQIPLAVAALLASLCMQAQAAGVNTDAVNELTPDAGVTVDGIVIKDGKASGTSTEAGDADGTLTTKDYVAIPRVGSAHVVVQTVNNANTNGNNLRAAYAAAAALTPGGAALAADNRAVVFVPPGQYDLGASTFTMDTDYVDVVGLSTACEDQRIYRSGGNVLRQTASDVRIENLLLHYIGASYMVNAYYPNASGVASPATTTVRNCAFRVNVTGYQSMRMSVEYAGTYEDCFAAGSDAFGGGGTASGTFTNCTGGRSAFGGGGTASGTFTNCTGGDWAFGGGNGGTASGTFTDCTGGDNAFGGRGTASGTFTDCAGGDNAFGGYEGTASGTFNNCIGGAYAFGGGIDAVASGTFRSCIAGDFSFGGNAPPSSGKFYHCVGGTDSFPTTGFPTVLYCVRDGAPYP